MDLFKFGPKFGPYHYAELPSYKRVKWGRLTGPSLIRDFEAQLKAMNLKVFSIVVRKGEKGDKSI